MRYIIDRFEGEFAVCEDESMKIRNILKREFPLNAKEGDIFYFDGKNYKLDISEMKRKKNDLNELVEELFEK